ncbi:hypothetical protein J2X36_004297 [Methylobacterium sp. BE186]|nr:hypothetical protein [Methylobacterium sp. BE186]
MTHFVEALLALLTTAAPMQRHAFALRAGI